MATHARPAALDMTKGSLLPQLLALLVPALATTLGQWVLLQGILRAGTAAQGATLEALQACVTPCELVLGIALGLATGCAAIVGQHCGSGDRRLLSDAVHTAMALSLALGLLLAVAGVLAAAPILGLLHTPEHLMGQATAYLTIFCGASALIVVLDVGVAIQRAVGCIVAPLLESVVLAASGVVLAQQLVGRMQMGVRGAACAFAAAHLLGCIIVLRQLTHARGAWRLRLGHVRLVASIARDMLACAVPLAIQNALAIACALAQPGIGSFEPQTAAAWRATVRLNSQLWVVSEALALATTAFAAQNFGAAAYERMRRGLRTAVLLALVLVGGVEALVCLHAGELVAWLHTDATVSRLAATMTVMVTPAYLLQALADCLAATIRGSGESAKPLLITLFGSHLSRIAWMALVVTRHHSIVAAVLSYPVSWGIGAIAMLVYYRHARWMTRSLRRARRRRVED